jgi:hypothetical protein
MMANAASAASPMSADEIKQMVTDRRIYLQVPLGGEFPLYYRANGQVDGSGTARGVGLLTRVNDTGRWWVNGNQLCQQWTTYERGRRFCFTLQRVSDERLKWVRNDGLAGEARIGN